jgi:serine protease inhibitor
MIFQGNARKGKKRANGGLCGHQTRYEWYEWSALRVNENYPVTERYSNKARNTKFRANEDHLDA